MGPNDGDNTLTVIRLLHRSRDIPTALMDEPS